MKYLDLFSGYGGFSLGIQQAYELYNLRPNELENSKRPKELHDTKDKLQQWECVGYSEIDKYAIQVYNKHFNHKNYGDITTIDPIKLPDFDLLTGGFPCQSFSIAGKRKGFDDTRGTLFFDIARILKEKRPKYLLLENVKGLLSHDSGRTFQTILRTLSDLGYDVEWQVLNAKNFGVPQNRERVFIVGYSGGFSGRKVFPIGGTAGKDIKVVAELNSETWKKRNESIRRVYGTDGLAPTIPTAQGGGVMAKIVQPVLTPDRINKRQNGRRFKENGEPAFTVTAQDRHGLYDGTKIRRLTPKECERLMGLPDNWTKEGTEGKISDSQRYKLCGNGVVIPVVKEIIRRLI